MSDHEQRREVTIKEVNDAVKRGDHAFLGQLQATGTVEIRDKEGNLKSQLAITSIETQSEDPDNANS